MTKHEHLAKTAILSAIYGKPVSPQIIEEIQMKGSEATKRAIQLALGLPLDPVSPSTTDTGTKESKA